MHLVHCKRILEQAKIRFVAESTTLFLFFDLLCCFGFHKHYCLKSVQKGNFAESAIKFVESATKFAESGTVCGIHKQIIINVLSKFKRQNKCADKLYVTGVCTRNPQKCCRWNPVTFWNKFKN